MMNRVNIFRDENLRVRFTLCIENTVKELIPVQQILQTYMSQETRDISLDGEVEDSMDPDVLDEQMEEMESQPLEGLEPEPEPLEGVEEYGEPRPTGLENEFKTIHSVQAPDPVSEPIAQPMGEPMGQPMGQPMGSTPKRNQMTMYSLVMHQSNVQKSQV